MRSSRPLLLLVPVAALLLAGCVAPAPSGATRTVVPKTPSASATPSPSATTPAPDGSGGSGGGTGGSGGGKTDPNAPQGQCADDNMRVNVTADPSGGAAGSAGYDVTITNVGSTRCVLSGYPGVSVVGNGNGTQLGPAADRQGDSPAPVTLAANGGTATAPMTVVNLTGGALSGCQVVAGDGWRVYPPHSFRAYFVKDATVKACANGPVWMRLTSGVVQG